MELGFIILPEQRGVYQPWSFPNPLPWGIFVETSSHEKVKVLITQSYPILCNPMDCSPPGSSVHGILQARILERIAIPFSRGSFQPRDQTQISHFAGGFFTDQAIREAVLCLMLWEKSVPSSTKLGKCQHCVFLIEADSVHDRIKDSEVCGFIIV